MSAALLSITKLSKRFGGVSAVDDVSFDVQKGQIMSLIGPNGAGKTTLFNCLTGICSPDQGVLRFHDKQTPIQKLSASAIAAKGIARTFQTIRLFKHATVLENVMIGAHARMKSGVLPALFRTRRMRMEEMRLHMESMKLLAFFGLEEKASELAHNLAYGHQRKLEMARALASEPELLLLDEPAAGMNPKEKEELLQLIRSIREKGVTVLLIEHDMKFVMPISDRVVVLDYGKKISEGTPKEVQNDPCVIEAYLGKPCS